MTRQANNSHSTNNKNPKHSPSLLWAVGRFPLRCSSGHSRQGRWWLPAGQGRCDDSPTPAGSAVAQAQTPLSTW